jgi:hypothetical protein
MLLMWGIGIKSIIEIVPDHLEPTKGEFEALSNNRNPLLLSTILRRLLHVSPPQLRRSVRKILMV